MHFSGKNLINFVSKFVLFLFFMITSAKDIMFLLALVCLSVYVSMSNITQTVSGPVGFEPMTLGLDT